MESRPIAFMRQVEGKISPWLFPRLDARRQAHISAVNNAFAALACGNLDRIYRALPQAVRSQTPQQPYFASLAKVRERYLSLSGQEQLDLAAAVAMHDIGYLHNLGMAHNPIGAAMVRGVLLENGILGVDPEAVTQIVALHGCPIDNTVHLSPRDFDLLPTARKKQVFIITFADGVGKPSGSILDLERLAILIGLQEGKFKDPKDFFILRLRSLLGPAYYSYLEETEFNRLRAIVETWPPDEQDKLFHNVANRLRNTCWPVFQEIGIIHRRIDVFANVVRRISNFASANFPDAQDVYLVFEPDFFLLNAPYSRDPYLNAVFGSENNYSLEAKVEDGKATIVISIGSVF